jgi:hypothetical protein
VTDDLPTILDYDALIALGHDEAEARWLLRHAPHGPSGHPYLTPDEYERHLPDLDRQRRDPT